MIAYYLLGLVFSTIFVHLLQQRVTGRAIFGTVTDPFCVVMIIVFAFAMPFVLIGVLGLLAAKALKL
jgi:hypothetical protein